MNKPFLAKILVAAALIALGAGGRILLQDVPNIETIMVVTIMAGAVFGGRWGLVVGLGSVALSDAFIGNSPILWFTWSAWAAIGFGSLLLKRSKKSSWSFVPKAVGTGIGAALFFYAWTNFGVWLIGSWYPPTFAGLIESYAMALPFLRFHLISTVLTVTVGAGVLTYVSKHVPVFAGRLRAAFIQVRS